MNNSRKALLLSVSALLSLSLTAPALAQGAATPKVIGVIDRDKVVSGYTKAQSAFDELKKGEEKVQKLVENANKQYEDAKKANKPPAELEGLQRRLQTEIDSEVKKLQANIQTIENQLEGEIDNAIKAEAAGHKVDVVLMKQAVLFGGVDITDGVLKRLAAVQSTAAAGKK
ncbi:MAG: OmpH family outer membrane protein [Candidatus Obscuribacterales bacterium]|nr:OmpH family outer membrane protein [Candidatus Obscuribacterales bacterium]